MELLLWSLWVPTISKEPELPMNLRMSRRRTRDNTNREPRPTELEQKARTTDLEQKGTHRSLGS